MSGYALSGQQPDEPVLQTCPGKGVYHLLSLQLSSGMTDIAPADIKTFPSEKGFSVNLLFKSCRQPEATACVIPALQNHSTPCREGKAQMPIFVHLFPVNATVSINIKAISISSQRGRASGKMRFAD